ncbi:glyceraldehyde 3-phosphate dehydrogenase NAD-binding domain-containing protein [Pokkaliibacter sp. MBI-7]|uniref:type I glyceraldehyde-3-phosphate dehydrogenase n=1 Tax=Pokkaliibacter sp. MBI-7 TaxID=3040600 RepID=UPI00244BACFC|nr:glyceraldehyde 3-phosphate dehydrogenase NAD-binding domain-containing protein [Pokkaliibacter sp. MBI-7]MDH2432673.1 glyceraldehyde 3-phosphate dehydrogenase NAD-binding domain-containing protein [Pokkaliibacter sp. MBI-7]
MAYRVAINGYGRIGQCVLRALYEGGYREQLQVVALNELSDIDTVAYLTRYDTTHGRFPLPVSREGEAMRIGDDRILVLNERQPENLPWAELDVDLVLECSGSFSERAAAETHLQAGAQRLLFSQPASADVDATIVYGINHQQLAAGQRIVSAASCTTNCLVPVLDLLDRQFGIECGVTTTIHSAMNDQPVIDAYHHTNLRLTRSALSSIIPVDTGLARGLDRLLPHLSGRFQCLAMRVPTINVSAMDITLNLNQAVTATEVNALLRKASELEPLRGLLGYTEEPHASVDFNHDVRSVVVDGTQTRVSGERMLKLMCWFDNEWGFANRMLDVSRYWLGLATR